MSALPILDDATFDALLAPLRPFEQRPKLAVAVSGGADSMALTLLTARWAAARGGSVLALTVDHGLRNESADEARQVGRWLAARGIDHDILTWTGPKPASGLQEAARNARYAFLLERCRDAGILHLLLAHHRGDLAETVLLRVSSGSGPDGLAAIAPVTPTVSARLLRPLLTISKVQLEGTLLGLGQSWIEDPSNHNEAFARVRMRQMMPALEAAGEDQTVLAIAAQARDLRTALDDEAAALSAHAATLSAAGFARVKTEALSSAAESIGRRVFDHVIRTISGSAYAPRRDRLDRLWAEVRAGLANGRSLGGCLIVPRRGGLLIQREPAAMAGPVLCQSGDRVRWDGRFTAHLGGQGRGRVGALGQKGWLAVKGEVGNPPLPAAVMATLPALLDDDGRPVAVPHLGWRRGGYRGLSMVGLAFAPTSPLTGGLVWHPSGTMC